MTEVVNPDGTWQRSTYDASGIRSMVAEGGVTTEFVTLNDLVVAGYNKKGEQTEHYFYGTSLLAAGMGLYDVSEGVQDVYYGLSGDANSQSVHPIKDYYFHGNQAAYNKAEMMLQVGTALGGLGTLAFSPTITAGNVANYANMMEQGLDSFDVVEEVRQGAGAEDIIQYERLKAEYAADEIANAERVGSGLKEDPYHRAASFITGEQLANGRSFTFTNGDGRKMQMFQLEGMLNEINGIYEYIVNPQGEVEHQLFKPGSGIIGPR